MRKLSPEQQAARDKRRENLANRDLIEAAPELLLQLEALVVQLDASGLIVPPGVAAVIAKAKRKQP